MSNEHTTQKSERRTAIIRSLRKIGVEIDTYANNTLSGLCSGKGVEYFSEKCVISVLLVGSNAAGAMDRYSLCLEHSSLPENVPASSI